jgi:hypothetical protein
MNCRIDIRLTKSEKRVIYNLATKQDMTITEYIKHQIFVKNPDNLRDEYFYHCPGDDKYNYVLIAITQQTQELLKLLLKNMNEHQAKDYIATSFAQTKEILENKYGYRKFISEKDE